MQYVHLIRGTDENGNLLEEFFFSEELAEWECAGHEVAERPHLRVKMTLEQAIQQYGIYFQILWEDRSGYHKEIWKGFSRAEERYGDLLFDSPRFLNPVWPNAPVVEIHPLSPTQVDRNSVMDLH